MKFQTSRASLLSLLSTVIGATDARGALPALSHIRLSTVGSTLTASATDMYISATAVGECAPGSLDGSACFPGRDFLDRVKAMPAGDVVVSVAKGEASTVKAVGAARRFQLHTLPAEDFPAVPADGAVLCTLPAATLAGLINLTAYSVSTDETRAHVNSLLLEFGGGRVRAVSTDGHRLSKAETAADVPAANWLLPLRGLTELRRLLASSPEDATITLGTHGPCATFSLGPARLTIKLVEATFPPYAQVIPKAPGTVATVPRQPLLDAIAAVALAAADRTGGVKITLAPGLIRISADSPEGGNAEDEVCAECEGTAPTFGVNQKYLAETLRSFDCDEVTISVLGELDPVVVKPVGESDTDVTTVTMPMRC